MGAYGSIISYVHCFFNSKATFFTEKSKRKYSLYSCAENISFAPKTIEFV